jgi:lysophospholipase L1-like esterase
MFPNKQINLSCLKQAAAALVFFALQSAALHTSAQAQVQAQVQPPAHFVAPGTARAVPAAALGATAAAVPAMAANNAAPACGAPVSITRLERPLLHVMRHLASGAPITIVAIGSSSTAGAGASSVDANYPSQLAADLRQRFPGHDITVLNRGINGEETDNMMKRFASDVIAARPTLVIWQVGTNSVLRDRSLDRHAQLLLDGIEQLKAIHADVMLMDMQYTPAVLAKPEVGGMEDQISVAAKSENVDLFGRFAVMRNWSEAQHISFETFTAPDRLHMNDWGYGCVAKLLTGAIAEAATRPITSAAAPAR